MRTEEAQKKLSELCKLADAICATVKTATRNGRSVTGQGFYADKFHQETLKFQHIETAFLELIRHADLDPAILDDFKTTAGLVCSCNSSTAARVERSRKLRFICQSDLIPRLEGLNASPIPITERVLPMAVVDGTRGYFETSIRQANGCYEHQWFDACAVMIRKFIEILIIEVYEAHSREAEIKDANGNFLMLRDLIDKVRSDTSWNLGRETKQRLPDLKGIGDRSAHGRRYFAHKQDIDNICPALRIAADELLHLAGLR